MIGQFFFNSSASATLKAIGKSLAIIEFDASGRILSANENFCSALGYSLNEIKGQHHSMFCESAYVHSPEYKAFWAKLGRGEFDAQEYSVSARAVGKSGSRLLTIRSYRPAAR